MKWVGRIAALCIAVPLVPILIFRWIPPPTSAVILEDRVARWMHHEPRTTQHRWTEWSAIAPAMRLAVIAAEDQKFPHHWGFDFDAISDAVDDASAGGRLRGASTISQQVARNLFLWQGRSWVRKGLEAYLTLLLEVCWPKRRILEVYVNIAEFGDGLYGVAAGSQVFFGKRPAALSAREAALMAAVLPNPHVLHVRRPSEYVQRRADWIERQMAQLGPGYLKGL